MSTLERIVRPALPPSIRITAVPDAAPVDSANSDLITLTGSGGGVISLSHSASSRWSKNKNDALFRVYDKVRIFNIKNGVVNRSQFVDTEVNTFIRMRDPFGIIHDYHYYHPIETDNIQIMQRDVRASIPDSQRG